MPVQQRIDIHNEIVSAEIANLDREWYIYYNLYNEEMTVITDQIQTGGNSQQYDFYFRQHIEKSSEFEANRLQHIENRILKLIQRIKNISL